MIAFLIELLNTIYKQILEYSFTFYSRLFLRNDIDKEIMDIIKDGQKKFNKEDLIIDEVNDVKFYKKTEQLKSFLIEVFLVDENKKGLNVVENLYIIKGYKLNNVIHVLSFDKKNSDDLGELVPENSNNYHF